MRYLPPLQTQDPNGSLADVSRVLDSRAVPPQYAPLTATVVQVAAGDTRRLAPRAAGQTVVIPAADATNYGAIITLLVDASLGTCRVKPVSGTVNGAASFTLAAGYQSLLVLESDGEGRWLTERAEGFPLTNGDKGDITVSGDGDNWQIDALAVGTAELAADAVTQAKLADSSVEPANLVADNNFGVPFLVRTVMSAGAAGTADDVTIYNANAPFAFRIVGAWLQTATAIGGSTVTLRTASGGGGSALSSALSSAATGTVYNNDTASRSVASGGSVFARRSDRGVAGTIIIQALRE